MRLFQRLVMAVILSFSFGTSIAHASVGGVIIKAIARYMAKETGQEATEQVVKQMTKQVGEELIERTAQKVVREGGEKSLAQVGELVAKNGPDVIRALDNAPDAMPVLKLLDEMPTEEIGKAASRLAAGSTGRELATLSTKLGTTVLRAETKHPGVGIRFARALGNDGAELSMKLSTDQAIAIGRHVDDIAQLPTGQQKELVAFISKNTDQFTAFVGRFVEKNPGKVLITAASVPIILANSDSIFGDGEIVMDSNGNALLNSTGDPIRQHKGIIPETTKQLTDTMRIPLQTTFYLLGAVVVVLVSLFGGSKVWKHYQKDQLELSAARTAAKEQTAEAPKNPEV